MLKENIKKNIVEHPILVVELILLLILLPLIIWIGVSETDEYAILQMSLLGLDIVALVVVPPVMLWILERPSKQIRELNKKCKLENSRKYRKQFVSSVSIENSYFGTCVFEKDANNNFVTLIEGMKGTQFGLYKATVDIKVNEKNLPMVLSKLEEVYKNADNILNQTYLALVDQCYDWDEKDSMGKSINLDYVRKNYGFIIDVHEDRNGELFVNLIGHLTNENGESHLGDHSFVTKIDCSTGEITHDLWG